MRPADVDALTVRDFELLVEDLEAEWQRLRAHEQAEAAAEKAARRERFARGRA